jgi:hypothetical protein
LTSISAKVAHVLAAKQTRLHACHWPGCPIQVPPAKWGCRAHWYRLPQAIRNRIWAAYRPGQEDDRSPARRYVEAAREAQAWIAGQQSVDSQAVRRS